MATSNTPQFHFNTFDQNLNRLVFEKADEIPYRKINVRRGNAMKYLTAYFLKERPKKIIDFQTQITVDKRKAMENVMAQVLLKDMDAYAPCEHYYEVKMDEFSKKYFIPRHRIDYIAQIASEFRRPSEESLYSDVTWEDDDDTDSQAKKSILISEDPLIVDLKTDRLHAKLKSVKENIKEVSKYKFKRTPLTLENLKKEPEEIVEEETQQTYSMRFSGFNAGFQRASSLFRMARTSGLSLFRPKHGYQSDRSDGNSDVKKRSSYFRTYLNLKVDKRKRNSGSSEITGTVGTGKRWVAKETGIHGECSSREIELGQM